MTKRPCGCGERGRHKSTCNLRGISKPGYAKIIRTCGCSSQGRHKRTCSLSNIIDYSKDNSHQKKMVKKINNPEFKKINKLPLYFALSKSYEDQKNYNEFSKYINLANVQIHLLFHPMN